MTRIILNGFGKLRRSYLHGTFTNGTEDVVPLKMNVLAITNGTKDVVPLKMNVLAKDRKTIKKKSKVKYE